MRWAGKVGFARQVETTPGIWEDVITEVDVMGDLDSKTERLDSGDAVLPQYRVTTSISFIADENRVPNAGMRYITMNGDRWQIATVNRINYPRIVVYPDGQVYSGPLPVGIS